MYNSKTFLAVIPARGGSKGIPRKNIIDINGKPLIQYTIDSAKESRYLDSIIVSTDDIEIKDIALKLGTEVPFLRPEKLGQDDTKTIDVLLDVVGKLNEIGECYDYIVLLQPTQPLRQTFHIDEAIEKIVKENKEGLASVSEVREHPILMREIDENGELHSILNIKSDVRRQDFNKVYKVNGVIYINRLGEDFNKNTSLNDNELGYIMDKKYDLDIDEPEDVKMFEKSLLYVNDKEEIW